MPQNQNGPQARRNAAEARQEDGPKRYRSIILAVVVNIIIILGVLGAFEIYFRHRESYVIEQHAHWLRRAVFVRSEPLLLMQPTPNGRRLIPNARVIIRNHRISGRNIKMDINSLGFRDDEIPETKGVEDLRILVLGDSITCGHYLQAEEVFVERIEEYLKTSTGNPGIEVVNSGAPDIGLKEEIDILEEKGLSIEPDIVILAFYLNDSRPPWGFIGEVGTYGFLRRHSILARTGYNNLILRNWVKNEGKSRFGWLDAVDNLDWRQDREAFLDLAQLAEYDWGAAWKEESWAIIRREFERLKAHQDKHGFKVVVVAFPVAFQVYAEITVDGPQRVLQGQAADFGFYYFDLLPVLRTGNYTRLFYDQCHPVPEANDAIGRAIAHFLMAELPGEIGID